MNFSQFRPVLILSAFLLIICAFWPVLILGSSHLEPSFYNSQPTPVGVTPTDQQCIGSFHTYAYTVPDKGSTLQETILPPAPWQIEASLPVPSKKDSGDTVAITRSVDKHVEVWINRESTNGLSDETLREFLIYRTNVQEWKIVSAQVEGAEVFVDRLYIASDGSVWGGNAWEFGANFTGAPALSKYNERSERFEFVQGIQEIPPAWKPSDQVPSFSEILLDSKGVFWIFAHKDAIYSYDSATQNVRRHAEIPDFEIEQVGLAPDGSMFLFIDPEEMTLDLQNDELFYFLPETGELGPLEIPSERWPARQRIVVDHSGRLWLDTVGWRDPDGSWHRMYPNLSLYFWKMEVEADYRWATPNVILESSNGYLWYRAEKGMAWFDPQTETGCWFTTRNTNVVEDKEHILWIVANQNLFKYAGG